MTYEQRLERIRAMAEGAGYWIREFEPPAHHLSREGYCIIRKDDNILGGYEVAECYDLATAEILLASLAPGPVV